MRDGTYGCRMSHMRHSCSAYSDLKHKVATLNSIRLRAGSLCRFISRSIVSWLLLPTSHTTRAILFSMLICFYLFFLVWFLIFIRFSLFFNFCFCFFSFCFPFFLFSFLITFCFSLRAWDPIDEPHHYRLPDTVG